MSEGANWSRTRGERERKHAPLPPSLEGNHKGPPPPPPPPAPSLLPHNKPPSTAPAGPLWTGLAVVASAFMWMLGLSRAALRAREGFMTL